ncbi:MAG: TIGR03915 family putative DNA repair protein [Spirochaetales bacterium]
MKTLIYDNTINGFLSSIFYSYKNQELGDKIMANVEFDGKETSNCIKIDTNLEAANKIKEAIIKVAGNALFEEISTVFYSANENKSSVLFDYIKLIFVFGKKVRLMLNDKTVIAYNSLLKTVAYERHSAISSIKFENTSENVLYAKISPKNNITELLLSHFANKLNGNTFIIHDTNRNVLGIYSNVTNSFFTYNLKDNLVPSTVVNNSNVFETLWKQIPHLNAQAQFVSQLQTA